MRGRESFSGDGMYATRWKQAAPTSSGIKGAARAFLRSLALSALGLHCRSLPDNFLRCLYCHYVFDDQRKKFENLLLELKALGAFVNTDTCLQMLQGQIEIDGRYFHLSFDDGFRNHLTNALPILKAQGVPAIFFVPSSLVGADWQTASVYCLETTEYHGVVEMLDWDDLETLISSGYEIGSHTKTHARFSAISSDPTLLEEEIRGSKQEIERRLGGECKYISWPYGTLADADATSLATTKKAGYRACFGAYRGSVMFGRTSPYSIPRHHFEVQWPVSHVKYFARGNMESAPCASSF